MLHRLWLSGVGRVPRRAVAVTARSAVVAAVVLLAAGCGGSDPSSSRTAIEAWARDDLGFPNAAPCLGPYLEELDVEGVTHAALRDEGLRALPPAVAQRVGDALVVCGLLASR